MAFVSFGARLLLAVVFAVAGVAKLRDGGRFRSTLSDLGFSHGRAGFVSVALPLGELAVSAALVPSVSARLAAAGAAALLIAFMVVIRASVLAGRTPDCACFGAVGAEPLGISTIARNAGLLVAVAVVLVIPSRIEVWALGSAWGVLSPDERALGTATIALMAALLALSLHTSRLRGERHRLLTRVAALERQSLVTSSSMASDLGAGGLPVGTEGPAFDLPRLEGDRSSLASLTADGHRALLIFMSAHCAACQELWPDIEGWQARAQSRTNIAVIGSGSAQTLELKVMSYQVRNVLLEDDARIAEAYNISLKPAAVFVGPGGLVQTRSVAGAAAIRALAREQGVGVRG